MVATLIKEIIVVTQIATTALSVLGYMFTQVKNANSH